MQLNTRKICIRLEFRRTTREPVASPQEDTGMTQCHPPGDARSAGIEAPAKGRTRRVSKREGMQRMLRRSAGSNAFLGCLAWASWFEGPRSPWKAARCRSGCWLGTCARAGQDREPALQMSRQKESEAAPLDGLDVRDSSGTSSTSPRALHRDPATARRPAGHCDGGRAAARCRSTDSYDGFAVALPTAPAVRLQPCSSRESAPVEEGRRRGGSATLESAAISPPGPPLKLRTTTLTL